MLSKLLQIFLLIATLVALSFFTPLFSRVGLTLLQTLSVTSTAANTSINPASQSSIETAPEVYVVLGGGLTDTVATDSKQDSIVLNEYSLSRLQTLLKHYQQQPLPIILSGVESAWMQQWLLSHQVPASDIISENASMNTCENARFTAKLTDYRYVYLVTGSYHMPRAQRQFALNGIDTVALPAPLAEPSDWKNLAANINHSRRTLYELVAYFRDLYFPQQDCREADDVSLDTLKRSRKSAPPNTF